MEARHWKLAGQIGMIPVSYFLGKEQLAVASGAVLLVWLLYDLTKVELSVRPVLRNVMWLLWISVLVLAVSLALHQTDWHGLVAAASVYLVASLAVWFLKSPEKPIEITPNQLIQTYWQAAGADDEVTRRRSFKRAFGGRLYSIQGVVSQTTTDTETDEAVVIVHYRPDPQTWDTIALYCKKGRYRPVGMGTKVTVRGRIRGVEVMGSPVMYSIVLEGGEFST